MKKIAEFNQRKMLKWSQLYLCLLFISTTACTAKQLEKNFLTLSGKITNHDSSKDSLYLFNFDNDKKAIRVAADGTFNDTMQISKPGLFYLNHEKGQYRLFLRNGYDLQLTWDASNIKNTIKFSGYGADICHFFKDRIYGEPLPFFKNIEQHYAMDRAEFKTKLSQAIAKRLKNLPKTDSAFLKFYTDFIGDGSYQMEAYDEARYFETTLGKGQPSPQFKNYENYAGGTTSLHDFKGKYVYIDMWATWCSPCKKEIPYLQKLEEEFHGKNIAFLSISVDSQKDKEKWKKMIAEKKMKGIQLIATNESLGAFEQAYKINGIPRFILLDPEGNIVSADAPRPSYRKELMSLFSKTDI